MSVLNEITLAPPEPGERCQLCHRRRNNKRKATSPEARKVDAGRLPVDRADSADDTLDSLQEYVGADSTSYARGDLFEKLVILGIQKREELKALYERTE